VNRCSHSRNGAARKPLRLPKASWVNEAQQSLRVAREVRYSLRVGPRTTTSIFLVSVFLIGIFSPTGVCALVCARHRGTDARNHSDPMPGMIHDHWAMNHTSIDGVIPTMTSQPCPSNCDAAELLSPSRRVVARVTVARTGIAVLDTTARFLTPDIAGRWRPDGDPPAPTVGCPACFNVLRV
jgi:hypothetical protein